PLVLLAGRAGALGLSVSELSPVGFSPGSPFATVSSGAGAFAGFAFGVLAGRVLRATVPRVRLFLGAGLVGAFVSGSDEVIGLGCAVGTAATSVGGSSMRAPT